MKRIFIAFIGIILMLQSCGLQNDLKKGLKVISKVSKEYDCLESSFEVNTKNGVKTVTIGIKCEDETGLYNGRVILEVHREMKKEQMDIDSYIVKLISENKEVEISAEDLDLALQLEENALQMKKDFEAKNYQALIDNSDADLVKDIERQNLFVSFDSLVQDSYPLFTGFNWDESVYQFGFERKDNHFLVLMFNPKTKKLNGIRFN